MRRVKDLLTPLMLLLAASGCDGHGASAGNARENSGPIPLAIRTAAGTSHRFTVELAVDEPSQRRGLMGRTALAEDGGMLFPFPMPRTASFWMKGTSLPLDLIFIRPDGTIAAILQGYPNDLHPISAGEPVSAVLEIRQGRAAALGLAPGDRVQWGDCTGAFTPSATWRPDFFCPSGPD